MAHNIEEKDGQHSIAFLGSRNDIWHRLGNEMDPDQPIEVWAEKSGMNFEVEMCPTYFNRNGEFVADGMYDAVRTDTLYPVGHSLTKRYKLVQPMQIWDWFRKYVSVDPRFQIDVAGVLKNGEIIWATAKYNGDINVAGDSHKARLLMTTSFDGTYATTNKMTMTRVVCNNTLDVAMMGGKAATVRTVHSAHFDAKAVGEQLGQLASSINQYKVMGDAMVQVHYSEEQVTNLFKSLLNIKDEDEELSTRKANQYNELVSAYGATVREGTKSNTIWTALNAVTRYVDHVRQTRDTTNGGADEARFISAQFTSGASMKKKAVELLTQDKKLQALLAA